MSDLYGNVPTSAVRGHRPWTVIVFQTADSDFDIVTLAGSAGGIESLLQILPDLPQDFPAAIVIVQHLPRHGKSELAKILRRRARLPVAWANDGDKLSGGRIFISPPNHELRLSRQGTIELAVSCSKRSVWSTPDLVLESLAMRYGRRSIAVVLNGMGRHGAKGAKAVSERQGMVISVRGPDSARFEMPLAAVEMRAVDLELGVEQIAFALVTLVMGYEAALSLP